MLLKSTMLASGLALMASGADAGCGLTGGKINILGNEFGAIQAVVAKARKCGGDGVTAASNLIVDHRDIQVAALADVEAAYAPAAKEQGYLN